MADDKKTILDEYGYKLLLVSADFEVNRSLVLTLAIGSYARFNPNSCVLRMGTSDGPLLPTFNRDNLIDLLTAGVGSFQPAHGLITPHELSDAIDPELPVVKVGWLTYRSAQLQAIPRLPKDVITVPIGTAGNAYLCTPSLATAMSEQGVRVARRLFRVTDKLEW